MGATEEESKLAARRKRVADRTREWRQRLPQVVRDQRRAIDAVRAREDRLRRKAERGWVEAERAGLLALLMDGVDVRKHLSGYVVNLARRPSQYCGTRELAEAFLLSQARARSEQC